MTVSEGKTVKERIEIALVHLMEEKPFPEITVTDLIQKAQVARVSFYRNFSSTADVIESLTDKMADTFLEDLRELLAHPNKRKVREFLFGYLYGFQKHFRSFCPENKWNQEFIMSSLHSKIAQLEQEKGVATLREKYDTAAKLSMIEGIIHKWGSTGFVETPEEMVDYMMGLLKKI